MATQAQKDAAAKKAAEKEAERRAALTPEERAEEDKENAEKTAKNSEKAAMTFDFAVNGIKLNRAKAWVRAQAALQQQPVPTGDVFVAAVKERYSVMGGLLRQD